MEWLMIVVLMYADDGRHEEKRFASRAECIAAAEEYVARYPELEWRHPSDELSITRPVARSTIRCIPAHDE